MASAALPIELDPLIVEANRRARRRRLWLAGVAVLAVAAAAVIGTASGSRSSGSALGSCAPPSGWKEKSWWNMTFGPRTIVLTNFRFGQMTDFYGLNSYGPAGGVMVAVHVAVPSTAPARYSRAFRVSRGDFQIDETPSPLAYVATQSHGRLLNAYVEVGTVTPATIAAANRALAGVQGCSA